MEPTPEQLNILVTIVREFLVAARDGGPLGLAAFFIAWGLVVSSLLLIMAAPRLGTAWKVAHEAAASAREDDLSTRIAELERGRAEDHLTIRQLQDWLVERQKMVEMIVKALPDDTDLDRDILEKLFAPPPAVPAR